MGNEQLYKQAALKRVQQLMDSNGVVLGALNNTPARAQLDAAVAQLSAQSVGQGVAVRQATGQITRQRQLVNTLRQSYMQPIAQFARATLKGVAAVPDMAALTNTGHRLTGNALVLAARAMATVAAPYAAQLTAAQFPPDELAQFSAATDAVAQAISDRAASKGQRVNATAGIKSALKSGREAVAMLEPVVTKMLAGNPGLLAEWKVAKRITSKPGVSSAPSVTPSTSSSSEAAMQNGVTTGAAVATQVAGASTSTQTEVPAAKVA